MKFIYPIFSKHGVFDDNQTINEYLVYDDTMFFEVYANLPTEIFNESVIFHNTKSVLHHNKNLMAYIDNIIDSDVVLYCENCKELSDAVSSNIPILHLAHHIQKGNAIREMLKVFNPNNISIYKKVMSVLLNYYHIESNKVYVSTDRNSGYLNTWFNMFNKTFRPTNRYDSINFTALSKKDASRSKIKSRFGDDGILLSLDFTAHNIYLIGKIINYDFKSENPYLHLGQYYESDLSYSDIKIKTFFNIFNQTESKYMPIDFFKKLNQYIDDLYNTFKVNGYVNSQIFNRKMSYGYYTDTDIEALPKHTLFNYYCQTYETEYNNLIMQSIINRISDNQNIKFIMYIYDELIFDLKYYEIPNIKSIFVDIIKELPYTLKVGYNFKDMENIDDLSIDYFTKKNKHETVKE